MDVERQPQSAVCEENCASFSQGHNRLLYIANEARTLNRLCARNRHPNLVFVIEHNWLSKTSLYYIDMELCSQDLGQYLKQMTASRWVNAFMVADSVFVVEQLINVMLIACHIASGLKYIHGCGEVHRDIKPSNGMWKLADFGSTPPGTSKRLIQTPNCRGTPSYRAPEILQDVENPLFNNKSDIWGFGCILFELLFGQRLFIGGDWEVMSYAQNSNEMTVPSLPICQALPAVNQIAESILSLLLSMVVIQTENSPNAEGVLDLVSRAFNWGTRERMRLLNERQAPPQFH